MSTPTTIVEGFSISHAAILDGVTPGELVNGDIYGVRDGSLEPDFDSYDNTGDDTVLSVWMWLNYATVNVQAGYIPFSLIGTLTGETVSSSGTGSTTHYSLPLWTLASMNVQTRPMLLRIPSKDSNGLVRRIDFVLYKVQFQPISFQGPTYKDGLLLNYTGRALMSSVNEAGGSLGANVKAVGRIVSAP